MRVTFRHTEILQIEPKDRDPVTLSIANNRWKTGLREKANKAGKAITG